MVYTDATGTSLQIDVAYAPPGIAALQSHPVIGTNALTVLGSLLNNLSGGACPGLGHRPRSCRAATPSWEPVAGCSTGNQGALAARVFRATPCVSV
jgi:hypothetical protein